MGFQPIANQSFQNILFKSERNSIDLTWINSTKNPNHFLIFDLNILFFKDFHIKRSLKEKSIIHHCSHKSNWQTKEKKKITLTKKGVQYRVESGYRDNKNRDRRKHFCLIYLFFILISASTKRSVPTTFTLIPFSV